MSSNSSVWKPIVLRTLRRALQRATDGASSRYVYARTPAPHQEYRITQVMSRGGRPYGYALALGSWVPIQEWQER